MGNAQTFKTDKIGFQVTSVSPLSPGAEAGLVVLTDFILTMNGQSLPFMEVEKIMSTVKKSVNRPVMLTVYNTESKSSRDVVLTPSTKWPGEGLLGIKLKLNTYEVSPNMEIDSNSVYNKEDDDFEDVVGTTPTSKKKGKAFTYGEEEFSNIGGDSTDPAPASKSKSFMKRFSFTGGK